MRDRPRQMEIIDAIFGGAQRPRQVGPSTLSVSAMPSRRLAAAPGWVW